MPKLDTPADVLREMFSPPEEASFEEKQAHSVRVLSSLDVPSLREVQIAMMGIAQGIDGLIRERAARS